MKMSWQATRQLPTKTAVNAVLSDLKISQYALAMQLGAAPPSVYQWLRNTKMSQAYADKFKELYKVKVTDAV